MKHIRNRTILALLAALFTAAAPLRAQTMALEQARAMRKDAGVAGEAMGRVVDKAGSDEVRNDARAAQAALGRITGQLDALIDGLAAAEGAKAADIYAGGTKYPAAADVEITPFSVPVGAEVVHVPVTLDRASPNTVIAHIRVYDGEGGRADPDTRKAVIFRPGDPLTKTVSFNVRNMSEGNNVQAVQYEVPDGGNRAGGGIRITAAPGAVNQPVTGGRAALAFEPRGSLSYSGTWESIRFDDEGGPDRFSTSLPHGRTQPGNGETGYYGTLDLGGHERTDGGLLLSTRRLERPVKVGTPAVEYPFLATVLSGHRTPETQFKHGSVEWVVRMPNRKGSWPALWLLPTGGWPPEIDVYEGFGYNGSWRFSSSLSANLHGGEHNRRTFTRPAMSMTMQTFGLDGTLDSAFHRFAVTVEPAWITLFVDGVETMRYANPFDGETWYPLANVAVKAAMDSPYDDGSGAMAVRSIKVWRAD